MGDRDTLPVVDPPEGWSDRSGSPDRTAASGRTEPGPDAIVHGAVLAAGTSSRFGDRNKLLATLDGTPLVTHATRTLCESALDDVTVVVGHDADRVQAAIADLPLAVVENPDYEAGQSTSVAVGVGAARDREADAVVLALGDMPDVTVETVDLLVESYRQGIGDAIAAAYEGTRGNPVLFDSRYYDALADVEGDTGGREILLSDSHAVAVETGDPSVLSDIDRPADL